MVVYELGDRHKLTNHQELIRAARESNAEGLMRHSIALGERQQSLDFTNNPLEAASSNNAWGRMIIRSSNV